jgi:hypothetical protein
LRFIWVRTRASSSLPSIGRTIVVRPHIEAPEQASVVPELVDDEDGQMAHPVERPDLRAQSQTIRMRQVEADDQKVEIAIRQPKQSGVWIGLARQIEVVLSASRMCSRTCHGPRRRRILPPGAP